MAQDIEKPDIANATTEPDEHEEIDVTPEMVEVGTAILYDEPLAFPCGVDFEAGDLVTRVYLAMERLRRSTRGQ